MIHSFILARLSLQYWYILSDTPLSSLDLDEVVWLRILGHIQRQQRRTMKQKLILERLCTIAVSTTTTMLLLAFCSTVITSVHGFQGARTTPSSVSFLPSNMHSRQSFATQPKFPTTARTTFQRKTPSPSVSSQSSLSTTALQASPLTWLASSPLGSISVLAGIVVVHEMGHYLAAKSFGMTVEEFSIGFGPKLFGFQVPASLLRGGSSSSDQKEEFNLRALPLGGYVRFPENYNNTDYEARKRQALATFQAEKEQERLRQQESDLDFGSRVLNILTFGAVLQQRKRKQESEELAGSTTQTDQPFWERNALQKEERAVLESVEIEYYDDPNLLQNRPWAERAVVLSAGVIFNLLLSFSIYFGTIGFGAGVPSPVIAPGVVVVEIPRPDSAASGVLKPGDVIVGMNGSPIMSLSSSSTGADSQRAITKLIAQIRATPDGEDIQLQVLRESAGKADLWKDNDGDYAQMLQKTQQVIAVKPQRASSTAAQTIGVMLSPNVIENRVLQSNNPIEAAGMAAQYAGTVTKETALGLASFFGQLLFPSSSGASSVSQVSGPIGLIKTGTQVIATNDIRNVLLFAAAISINLGVVNAFPLPALDGGQLIFVLSEAILGRKVDQRLQEGITGASLLFLLIVSAGAAIGDIGSIFGF